MVEDKLMFPTAAQQVIRTSRELETDDCCRRSEAIEAHTVTSLSLHLISCFDEPVPRGLRCAYY